MYTLSNTGRTGTDFQSRKEIGVLCATLSEFNYSDSEGWKKLKPYPIERVLEGYWIFGGLVVIEDSPK